MTPWCKVAAFVFLLSRAHAHKDCGREDPPPEGIAAARLAEEAMYGKRVDQMTTADFAEVHAQSLSSAATTQLQQQKVSSDGIVKNGIIVLLIWSLVRLLSRLFRYEDADIAYDKPRPFQMVGVPLVYHVLPNQDNGSPGYPSMTVQQQNFTTSKINQLFRIYDRTSTQEHVQFISYVHNDTLVHDDIQFSGDCTELHQNNRLARKIVTSTPEWRFKVHVIVCELNEISGWTVFPYETPVKSPYHNSMIVDYRALACYDDEGLYMCDNGREARWWRSRSVTVAHELGHLWGLLHTFQGGCEGDGDGVADTPPQTSDDTFGCPGMLPYNKNTDPFAVTAHANTVNGACTAKACCVSSTGGDCSMYNESGLPILENEVESPGCCSNEVPLDSCPLQEGVDPSTNIMSYSPDFCLHELTVGQMARMSALIRQYKTYMYCNYATTVERQCARVPCASIATSPNCLLT